MKVPTNFILIQRVTKSGLVRNLSYSEILEKLPARKWQLVGERPTIRNIEEFLLSPFLEHLVEYL
jgi:hypothetical protein